MYSKEVERVGTFGKMEIKNFFHQIAKLNLRHCKYIRTSQQDHSSHKEHSTFIRTFQQDQPIPS